jgi:DNA-binding NarL/FixJ family response regulator
LAEVQDRPRSSVGVITVDDQEVFRRAARDVIEATPGFVLLGEAASGEEALALAEAVDPDLVFVDARMPAMDGFETIRRLRDAHPEAIIVLISTEEAAGATSAACGATAFLPKASFGQAELIRLWDDHGPPRERGTAPP